MSKVCQLFSGSSGNSILISSKGYHFLVDVGVSARRCERALMSLGVSPDAIDGIFVTHEHRDHSSGVRVFSTKHKVPVFAPLKSIEEMLVVGTIDSRVEIFSAERNFELCGIEIQTFHQSHDSVDCIGYRLNLPDGRAVSVCTDTGYITDEAKSVLPGTDIIFIESNHEVSMVNTGPYPYPLKKRILGPEGHLSNFACAEYIKELAQSGTTRFVLSHLSEENNIPGLARQTAVSALSEIDFKEDSDYRLYVSARENSGRGIAL